MSPTQQPTAAPNIEALPKPPQPTDEERNQKYLEQFRKEIPENRVAIQHQFQEAVAVQAGARQNIAALIMDQTAVIADPKAGDSERRPQPHHRDGEVPQDAHRKPVQPVRGLR